MGRVVELLECLKPFVSSYPCDVGSSRHKKLLVSQMFPRRNKSQYSVTSECAVDADVIPYLLFSSVNNVVDYADVDRSHTATLWSCLMKLSQRAEAIAARTTRRRARNHSPSHSQDILAVCCANIAVSSALSRSKRLEHESLPPMAVKMRIFQTEVSLLKERQPSYICSLDVYGAWETIKSL